jgi:hypothetical protein
MGLDSYWVDPEARDLMELVFQPALKLVGGVLSDHDYAHEVRSSQACAFDLPMPLETGPAGDV